MGLADSYAFGQAHLEADEKEGLKKVAVSTTWELDQLEQLNIEMAVEWTIGLRFREDYILTEEFVKLLHKKMFGEVWTWAGTFRKSDKNFGVEWTQIGVELRKLLDDTSYWISNHVYGDDEIALRFKHKLVKIHCFPNGNGRHSRLMADVIIDKIFGGEVFSWKHSNGIKPDQIRKEYIQAIHQADQGKIEPLIQFARS